MKPIEFKLLKTQYNTGHCQLDYYVKYQGETLYYCLQEYDKGRVRLMRCSKDREPSHEAKLRSDLIVKFELPVVDEGSDSEGVIKLKNACLEWIDLQKRDIKA